LGSLFDLPSTSGWKTLHNFIGNPAYPLNQLIFGDFNGDGKTDVIVEKAF